MSPQSHRRQAEEFGFISVEILGAVFLSFLVLVALMNIIVVQYGLGVVRAAADEGARSGARLNSGASATAACEARAADVLQSIGRLADASSGCTVDGDQVRSVVNVRFEPWFPGVPAVEEQIEGRSVLERPPLP